MKQSQEFISLNDILARGEYSSSRVLYALMHPLVEHLIEMQNDSEMRDGALTIDSIYFSPNLKQIVVTSASDNESENVRNWGNLILIVLEKVNHRDKMLRNIAARCSSGEIAKLGELHLQLERRISYAIYHILLFIIILGLIVMGIIHFLW